MMLRTILFLLIVAATVRTVQAEDRTVFRFDTPNAAAPWQTVNDGVMGGRSVGRFKINADKKLEFYGNLSLANNGGFASVRARAPGLDLNKGDVIVARVRGDGREYKFNVYAQRNLSGFSYRQSFKTKKGEWIEVQFPVDKFVATWRGRTFSNQRLDPTKASGIGILLGDKREGSFKLEVEWIQVRAQATSSE